eukprot:CAMPEP_0117751848 /NCGR_PEP_ID=MMETSP0947-20121206/11234_1 /TAXON_ID=44440 /ORGANISM="Chattonella subsalsa, Strain CCMP2191" /LENGTH=400 /DNA_ID=CAMNT_0005570337 /DNA_START=389 /DNA_END=1591 /DNA_ORIENTATION=-
MDNVSVQIDCAAVFRIMGDKEKGEDPSLVRKFVHEVTPRGLEQQLRDALEEAIRSLARSVKHREVYGLRSMSNTEVDLGEVEIGLGGKNPEETGNEEDDGIDNETFVGSHDVQASRRARRAARKGAGVAATMCRTLNKQFHHQGVDISQIIIKNVKLPHDITEQMSNKTMIVSENAQQKMNQQFEMQKLKHENEMADLIDAQAREKEYELEEGQEEAQKLELKLEYLKSMGNKEKLMLEQSSRTQIQSLEADAQLQIAKINMGEMGALATRGAKANKEAAKLKAECDVYVETKLTEAGLVVAQNEARAAEVLAQAEGRIAPMIRALKEFETNRLQTEVYKSLSLNPDLVISDSSGSKANATLIADAILQQPPLPNTNRGQVLTELLVLKNRSKLHLGEDL